MMLKSNFDKGCQLRFRLLSTKFILIFAVKIIFLRLITKYNITLLSFYSYHYRHQHILKQIQCSVKITNHFIFTFASQRGVSVINGVCSTEVFERKKLIYCEYISNLSFVFFFVSGCDSCLSGFCFFELIFPLKCFMRHIVRRRVIYFERMYVCIHEYKKLFAYYKKKYELLYRLPHVKKRYMDI